MLEKLKMTFLFIVFSLDVPGLPPSLKCFKVFLLRVSRRPQVETTNFWFVLFCILSFLDLLLLSF